MFNLLSEFVILKALVDINIALQEWFSGLRGIQGHVADIKEFHMGDRTMLCWVCDIEIRLLVPKQIDENDFTLILFPTVEKDFIKHRSNTNSLVQSFLGDAHEMMHVSCQVPPSRANGNTTGVSYKVEPEKEDQSENTHQA